MKMSCSLTITIYFVWPQQRCFQSDLLARRANERVRAPAEQRESRTTCIQINFFLHSKSNKFRVKQEKWNKYFCIMSIFYVLYEIFFSSSSHSPFVSFVVYFILLLVGRRKRAQTSYKIFAISSISAIVPCGMCLFGGSDDGDDSTPSCRTQSANTNRSDLLRLLAQHTIPLNSYKITYMV